MPKDSGATHGRLRGMLRADALTVVHHDDTISEFTDVAYSLDRGGLRVVTRAGDEKSFPVHDILTTHVVLAHQRRPADDHRASAGSWPVGA
jgi:hypothetical protein